MPAYVSEQLTRRFAEHLLRAPSLQRLVEGYLISLRSEGKSPNTIRYYGQLLRNFLWWCDQQGIPANVAHITTAHFRQFLIYVGTEPVRWGGNSTSCRKPVSQTTIQHYYKALHIFSGWLVREELVLTNLLDGIKKPKAQNRIILAFTLQEVRRLLTLCDGKSQLCVRDKAIMMLFLDTGIRLSELCNLTVSDVDFQQCTILVRMAKGQKQRVVHMGNRCQKAVWKWLALFRQSHTDKLFVRMDGEPLQIRGLEMLVKRLCRRASVVGGGACHRLRHTFTIEFLRAGGDVMSPQYLLGHSSLEMVKRYLGPLSAEDAARAHQRHSPVDSLRLK